MSDSDILIRLLTSDRIVNLLEILAVALGAGKYVHHKYIQKVEEEKEERSNEDTRVYSQINEVKSDLTSQIKEVKSDLTTQLNNLNSLLTNFILKGGN